VTYYPARKPTDLYRAINIWRSSHSRRRYRPRPHPFGDTYTYNGVTARCVEPDHVYMVSRSPRVERVSVDGVPWRNRIHHVDARYIATHGRHIHEVAVAACGATLTAPLFLDLPARPDGVDAAVCARCELAWHPSPINEMLPCVPR
jgi:hypothetical protein